jgi:cyclic pyranopterin monophosphate synthase
MTVIDVSTKYNSLRTATAQARLSVNPQTLAMIQEKKIPKGDPLEVAKVAAVQAAKHTSDIIPYCHPMPVEFVGVEYEFGDGTILVRATVKAIYRTGVEMEALTAATVAALTLYDMMKMVDEGMTIREVELLSKTGGKSDFTTVSDTLLRAAVLVMSDSIASGKKSDTSGQLIVARLKKEGVNVEDYRIIPDDTDLIASTIREYADERHLDLVITTGGTGFSRRDSTPEAMASVLEREAPGIAEAARAYGQERTPYAMLSRARAGLRGNTLIVNLPGSRGGVADSLNALFPGILHSFPMLRGGRHDR